MDTLTIQQALWRLGYDPHGCDGAMGPNTETALKDFCVAMGLPDASPGNYEPALQDAISHLPPFIQAKNFNRSTRPNPPHPIQLIVIHTMEAPEKPKTAFNVASWFAGPSAPQASAHFCVDDAQVIQCVLECDVAWHAPGANSNGIGIEHAGYASQTPEQWDDDYSKAVLANSAKLAAGLCKRFGIPIVRLSIDDLKAGKLGFCGHVDVTNAFSNGRGHVDPGVSFPWDSYLALVQAALAAG
jgi:N-acetyl-anhydromuramyl-L-alanine amidase AmpD